MNKTELELTKMPVTRLQGLKTECTGHIKFSSFFSDNQKEELRLIISAINRELISRGKGVTQ